MVHIVRISAGQRARVLDEVLFLVLKFSEMSAL